VSKMKLKTGVCH